MLNENLHIEGGVSENPFGSQWFANHGAVCAKIGKPCIAEEYGATANKPTAISPWQATALKTSGVAADMFWQWGDTLSTGQTHNDGYTIYYGSADHKTLVLDHVAAINKANNA